MEQAYFLGFDYGSKRIGVAVGQKITNTATPLQIVTGKNNKPDWDAIEKIIRNWQPAALIIGLPLHADGSDSHTSKAARRFSRQLEGRYHLPVYLIEETLSSHAAAEYTEGALDAASAQIILETWFCTH
ncbi:Holliday junction resolvase RuvX [Candidatus Venteria ishoeyi]|uniref:Putative pre-16S rRNA nuclease n=1 Tax=Candidatus Venteria ishoeyi TaxID=1899563 RepID=A0A1H6FI16_9GAMM|nr:Holliday junction resolvase RuvX [Candidatus Venteria ishoeyi]MDM8548239.1 Holliday junction resolvase RuvX [Candidatus Venteria ishoeyi]SEH09019.1 Putative Holliday junction resolvase [Candidatus Venteria ishoeyi]